MKDLTEAYVFLYQCFFKLICVKVKKQTKKNIYVIAAKKQSRCLNTKQVSLLNFLYGDLPLIRRNFFLIDTNYIFTFFKKPNKEMTTL